MMITRWPKSVAALPCQKRSEASGGETRKSVEEAFSLSGKKDSKCTKMEQVIFLFCVWVYRVAFLWLVCRPTWGWFPILWTDNQLVSQFTKWHLFSAGRRRTRRRGQKGSPRLEVLSASRYFRIYKIFARLWKILKISVNPLLVALIVEWKMKSFPQSRVVAAPRVPQHSYSMSSLKRFNILDHTWS